LVNRLRINVADKAAVVNRLTTTTTSDNAPSEELTQSAQIQTALPTEWHQKGSASTPELSYFAAGPLPALLPQKLQLSVTALYFSVKASVVVCAKIGEISASIGFERAESGRGASWTRPPLPSRRAGARRPRH